MPANLQALAHKLINLILDTVFVVDGDNRIVLVSDARETLLGYRADELVGTAITDYMHPDDLAATRASIVRFARHEQAHRLTCHVTSNRPPCHERHLPAIAFLYRNPPH